MSKFSRAASLAVVSLFVLGFSLSAEAKPVQVDVVNTPDVNVANTPDVNVLNTPDVNIVSIPDVNVSNLPSETSSTIIVEGEITGGDYEMNAFAFSVSSQKRIVLRHIACEANSFQPGTKDFMLWLEGDNGFILPITGFFERMYYPGEVPIPTNYFNNQILNEVSIGIEDFGEDIYLKGVTNASTGVGPFRVTCNIFVSEVPNN